MANESTRSTMRAPFMPRFTLTPAAVVTVALALFWLLSAVVAIENYGFRYPAFDQFRNYRYYLALPFPENVLQLENGHRPILPALVRLAEVEWLQANQLLQLGVGLACALAALTLIVVTICRDQRLVVPERAALVLGATLALFWLGNARMLMHGNESLQTYSVLLLTILGGLALQRARDTRPLRSMIAAALCCAAATFCFGTGVASFAALFVGGWLVRMPARSFAVPALLLALSLAVYVGGLPGHDGVRHSLLAHPLDSLGIALRWLAAPWMQAWLGLAPPPLIEWMPDAVRRQPFGRLVVDSAGALAAPWGPRWTMDASLVVGGIGAAAFVATVLRSWRAGASMSPVQLLGVLLATMGATIGALLSVSRLPLFREIPSQIFADRYLPWNCLFWLGLALSRAGRPQHAHPRRIVALAILAAVVLYPTHRVYAGWSEVVHRNIGQSAIAAQLGIWDPERFPDGPDASRDDVQATLAILRERRLSMFAEPGAALEREGFRAPATLPPALPGAHARVVRSFADTAGGGTVSALEGALPEGARPAPDTLLVVMGRDDAFRGLARPSFVAHSKRPPLRIDRSRRNGFDGYARGDPCAPMTLIVLTDGFTPQATIPVQPPPSCGALPAPPGADVPAAR